MKTLTITMPQRTEIMRLMRAYDVPDDAIGAAFNLSRQRVHKLVGPRQHVPADVPVAPDANASERLPGALKAWRLKHNLSQTEAAQILGVQHGYSSISKWESGRGGCAQPEILLRLIEILDQR